MLLIPGYRPPTRNIQVLIDSVALLAGAPQERCVFLCDDGQGSRGQGSNTLSTEVTTGQNVSWQLIPIDLQAPAWIAGIDFGQSQDAPATEAPVGSVPAWACRWEGCVPPYVVAGQVFPYRILLTFADGGGPALIVEGMQLMIGETWPGAQSGPQYGVSNSDQSPSGDSDQHPAGPTWAPTEAPASFGLPNEESGSRPAGSLRDYGDIL